MLTTTIVKCTLVAESQACLVLTNPVNGNVAILGSIATYTCNPGYTIGWAPTHVSANPEHGLELLQLAVSVKSSNYVNSCEL